MLEYSFGKVMTLRILQAKTRMDGDNMIVTRTVRVPKRGLRSGHLYDTALNLRLVSRLRCDCGHCRAGYDCCGNYFPNSVNVTRVKRGIRVETTYVRNI